MPARAPQEEFGPRIRPRIGPRKRRSSPKRAVDKFGFALALSLSLSLPLSLSIFLFSFYVSVHIHLYTSLDLVFSCSLVLPLRAPKAEFGPRIGPRKRRSGPERQLTSSDLLSLSLSLFLSLYIYIYNIYAFPFTFPYISIHLYTSLYLVFSCSRVLPLRAPKAEFGPRIGPRIGPRKRRSGPERTVDKFGFALSLSLSLPLSLNFLLHVRTSPYISLLCFFMFSCVAATGPEKGVRATKQEAPAPKHEFGPRKIPKEQFRPQKTSSDLLYIYISF